jgi:formamidopyrimidine-DNA glycosylase
LFWDRRGLGRIELLSGPQYDAKLADGRLGPDAIAISLEEFRNRFKRTRREIKVALLDQSLIAGVGNLYASEILHLSGVHPQARCDRLNRQQWMVIYETMRAVLIRAIQYEGSTLADGTYRNAQNNPGSYQNHHLVYDRAGKPCPNCRQSRIKRIVQAQRSTFFCSKCQHKTRSR